MILLFISIRSMLLYGGVLYIEKNGYNYMYYRL